MRKTSVALFLIMTVAFGAVNAQAAGDFAHPLFRVQWQRNERHFVNYWGPSVAERMEPYAEAPGGQRLVQYFDKGRMELTDPGTATVTNGLLAKELVTGQVQLGNDTFRAKNPPQVPIAGDPDGIGPTYRWLNQKGKVVFEATQKRLGTRTNIAVTQDGDIVINDLKPGNSPFSIAAYDRETRHNVMDAFAGFRDNVGLETLGYAVSEPFIAKFTVGGVNRTVAVQVFERRILTFTEANLDEFKVEFGNIGLHYENWRH